MAITLFVTFTALVLCPPVPEHADGDLALLQSDEGWAIARSDLAERPPDALAGSDPAEVGAWEAPIPWDVIAIHAVMLPTGEVLHYSYPDDGSTSRARTWDPVTGVFTPVQMDEDLFCSGHAHLADGRVLITGGNDYGCEFQGRFGVKTFDPVTGAYVALGSMEDGRWYPSNLVLHDGRVLILSGLDRECQINTLAEVFDPLAPDGQQIQRFDVADRGLPLYPRVHVLTDGRVAYVGEGAETHVLDVDTGWGFVGSSHVNFRCQNTSLLLPGRADEIMIIGGQCPLTNTCEIIDFKAADPTWRFTAPMQHARAHADAVILPDKTVMVVGGGRTDLYEDPVLQPELFDPATETWTSLPAHVHGRMYHSTSVLLPDGRVVVAGQDSGPSAFMGEIYQPAYLHRGPRPMLATAPSSLIHGAEFEVTVASERPLDALVLIKLTANTHSVNLEQRLVDLGFAPTDDPEVFSAQAPAHGGVAPPGDYFLFAIDDDGVPSIARIVRVTPPRPGDANRDGAIDIDDLLLVLGTWGPCGSPEDCDGDLDGDGDIDTDDILTVLANWP